MNRIHIEDENNIITLKYYNIPQLTRLLMQHIVNGDPISIQTIIATVESTKQLRVIDVAVSDDNTITAKFVRLPQAATLDDVQNSTDESQAAQKP